MTITASQRATIDAIVAIFETGGLPSTKAYSTCTILHDGAGITYGLHQATRGALEAVLVEYGIRRGPRSTAIREWLDGHHVSESAAWSSEAAAPDWVRGVMSELRLAGAEAEMQRAQQVVFERDYWWPAYNLGASLGLVRPLSYLVLYDTSIQSGIERVGKLRATFAARPPARGGDELVWTRALAEARLDWLASFTSRDAAKQALVRRSAYRAEELVRLVAEGRWDLARPFTIRNQRLE